MKKLNYTQPELELVKFGVDDVLATSEAAQGYNPNAEQGGGWNVDNGGEGFAL